jgi:hypothetical protein
LLCPGSDELLVLSGTGAVTWDLLAEPVAEQELIGIVADGFGVDESEVASTLLPFVRGLAAAGAVAKGGEPFAPGSPGERPSSSDSRGVTA